MRFSFRFNPLLVFSAFRFGSYFSSFDFSSYSLNWISFRMYPSVFYFILLIRYFFNCIPQYFNSFYFMSYLVFILLIFIYFVFNFFYFIPQYFIDQSFVSFSGYKFEIFDRLPYIFFQILFKIDFWWYHSFIRLSGFKL